VLACDCAARIRWDTQTVSENVELLRRSADVFNAGDLERYFDEFVAPDVVWRTSAEDPDAATHDGREAFGRYIEQWMDSFEGCTARSRSGLTLGTTASSPGPAGRVAAGRAG
jgi:ketosteroid isomerase-like protein